MKNPKAQERGRIFFRDVGDYLTREEKLAAVATFGSVAGVTEANAWTHVKPDAHGDWTKQRDESFGHHIVLGTKDLADSAPRLFANFSLGVGTNRDAWAYGPSRSSVAGHMEQMIRFYNAEVERFDGVAAALNRKARDALVDGFISTDSTRISWTRSLKKALVRGSRFSFDSRKLMPSLYRPFAKQWLYFDRNLNEYVSQMPRIFPSAQAENRVIAVSASESRSTYSVLMADVAPSLHAADSVGSQCFPLYLYDAEDAELDDEANPSLFAAPKKTPAGTARRDGITDAGLAHFRDAYPGEKITKEDLFYYVYGILHSTEYRGRYADNLGKELPRIPRVKTAADFWAFSKAGRALGDLHVGYERVPEYQNVTIDGPKKPTGAEYRVEKMTFGKGKDKTVIHYNGFITVRDVPLAAYEYVVNGKSAIEWVRERQCVFTEDPSGIVKDANAWATETVGDPRYPLSLLLRVITVSLETMKIVRGLPPLSEAAVYPKTEGREYLMVAEPVAPLGRTNGT